MKNKVHSTKLKHYEKATKFEKNLPPVLTKQLFLLSSVKTSWRFFSNFCGLLNFKNKKNKKATTINSGLKTYSRVHISSDTAFLKILKKPSIVQE